MSTVILTAEAIMTDRKAKVNWDFIRELAVTEGCATPSAKKTTDSASQPSSRKRWDEVRLCIARAVGALEVALDALEEGDDGHLWNHLERALDEARSARHRAERRHFDEP